MYMYHIISFYFGSLLSGDREFLLALSAASKQGCHGYMMKHVWISAELCGGAPRIKRR